MRPAKLGILLIVSGPSGAGKSTICREIRKKLPDLHFSVSCTTRQPRIGEQDGVDYYFITHQDFEKKIENDEFLEYAKVHSNYYGTLKSEVIPKISNGIDVLLDIDVQGAMQIKQRSQADELLSKCIETVFIGPPSFTELEKRLRARATEDEEKIKERLRDAAKELEFWQKYDYLIINKKIDNAVSDMLCLIDILHKKTIRLKESGFYE